MKNSISLANFGLNLISERRYVPLLLLITLALTSCDENGEPLANGGAEPPTVLVNDNGENSPSQQPTTVADPVPLIEQPDEEQFNDEGD